MRRKKPRNIDNVKQDLKIALEQYQPDRLRDSEETYKLKEAIQKLPEVDKIIFLLYTELQSYTELSKVLGVSRSTCFWIIKRIREDLKEILEGRKS